MSLTFDFPGFHKQWTSSTPSAADKNSRSDNDSWEHDLKDLSGEEEEQHVHEQQDHADGAQQQAKRAHLASVPVSADHYAAHDVSMCDRYVPDAVLLLVADRLGLQDVLALACCCQAWYECLVINNSSVWAQQEHLLLGCGWPWPPYVGARPLQLPASLGPTSLLHLKSTVTTSKVALQYFVMRKGYEVMLDGFEALWAALDTAAAATLAAAAAAAAGHTAEQRLQASPAAGATGLSPGPSDPWLASSSCQSTVHPQPDAPALQQQQQPPPPKQQQQQQQQSVLPGGRQLQRLVDKLAQHNWELTYSGFSTALAARCDTLADQLRTAWQQQQQQQQSAEVARMSQEQAPAGTGAAAAAAAAAAPTIITEGAAGGAALQQQTRPGASVPATTQASPAAAAAVSSCVLPAAVLADCAGGILREVEAVAHMGAGELLAGEPELLLAATRRGVRPAAAIALWGSLLSTWERYRRWLDLVTARCGLLGARVAAARQLAEPSASGPPNAALLPHLRNKGLLLFRGHVLLAYGLRRPLQQAALWLAAVAAVDASAWRAGGGCSEADLELLIRVRKFLTELDVADGQDEDVGQHTHGKFRRCFGALLTKQRRNRCLPACAW